MTVIIKRIIRLLIVASYTMFAGAHFASADTSRTTAGAGTRLCSAFLQEYAQSPQTTAWIYLSWAQGYLSAVNLQRSQFGETAVDMLPSDFDLSKQIAFLKTYCLSLPDRHFDQAATQMYFELLTHHINIKSMLPP